MGSFVSVESAPAVMAVPTTIHNAAKPNTQRKFENKITANRRLHRQFYYVASASLQLTRSKRSHVYRWATTARTFRINESCRHKRISRHWGWVTRNRRKFKIRALFRAPFLTSPTVYDEQVSTRRHSKFFVQNFVRDSRPISCAHNFCYCLFSVVFSPTRFVPFVSVLCIYIFFFLSRS